MTEGQKKTAGIAVASLVLGILSYCLLGPLTSIPAVICGHVALSKIKKNADTLQGGGLALAGLIMGYIQLGTMVLLLPILAAISIPAFAQARFRAHEARTMSVMKMLEMQVVNYELENGRLPADINELQKTAGLESADLMDPWGNPLFYKVDGKQFTISSLGRDGVESEDDIIQVGSN